MITYKFEVALLDIDVKYVVSQSGGNCTSPFNGCFNKYSNSLGSTICGGVYHIEPHRSLISLITIGNPIFVFR